MSIRVATADDLEILKDLFNDFCAERNDKLTVPYDPDVFMESLVESIESDKMAVLLLDDGEGFFMGTLETAPFSTAMIANELLWYTRPVARGKGLSLLRAYISWAKEKKVECIFMNLPEPRIAVEWFGFNQAETGYFMRLPIEPQTQLSH